MRNFTHISLEIEGDLDTWEVAEERPTGSRQKLTLIRSRDGAYFIFKYPKSQREHQICQNFSARLLQATYWAGRFST